MEKPKQQAYVQLGAEDAVIAKKDVLAIEMNLLQIITKITAYKKLRKQEVKDRIELKKRLREAKSGIIGLTEIFPVVEKPKIKFRKSSAGKGVFQKRGVEKEANFTKSIEEQLSEIKARLKKLDEG